MLEQGSTTTTTPQSGSAPRPARTESQAQAQAPAQPQTEHSLTQSAGQAVQSVGELYRAADSALQNQMQGNPYVTLAAAAAVGFVVGGGMRSPIGQLLVRMSVRAFGPPLVNAALQNVLERATSRLESERVG